MSEEMLVTPPTICGFAEVEFAHQQMRRHRECNIDRCAWKRVAYHTLVHFRRIVPQELSPRERAHQRGIYYPTDDTCNALPVITPTAQTYQQVLDGLTQLVRGELP
ncbi:hypothetical protein AB4Y89_24325 [Terriglobus sp. 2YAB30_2]|uniref:hypothetical protein n=1 Tax=Terriglobus sp. 2YAB30_2 TaxID=3233023 RepID=UPI003F95660B